MQPVGKQREFTSLEAFGTIAFASLMLLAAAGGLRKNIGKMSKGSNEKHSQSLKLERKPMLLYEDTQSTHTPKT
ncbi:hypothetical protein METBIDRAFT_31844 [Metschnikowia bicuspidata var. bicuspidata NRRL YB-4993]|uniref:Uncharacterized protein n=1 Tax=Metschnikowia bicuspidata var. bicuspidata NRRL YB-4993 TaxID=869754 RepID=A0A1A0HBB2_9ASCO|nr:hypothetical protein METBIDRAFT_31844 [Metschnikowia bicuspidata var. bicuspidata NRRL YB-4993]OBA21301.1 hypothetical protein METBIDRAFT_31844 [Metschnikowia bicuspidata var. bicuspidata NRRL YB-4993]